MSIYLFSKKYIKQILGSFLGPMTRSVVPNIVAFKFNQNKVGYPICHAIIVLVGMSWQPQSQSLQDSELSKFTHDFSLLTAHSANFYCYDC